VVEFRIIIQTSKEKSIKILVFDFAIDQT